MFGLEQRATRTETNSASSRWSDRSEASHGSAQSPIFCGAWPAGLGGVQRRSKTGRARSGRSARRTRCPGAGRTARCAGHRRSARSGRASRTRRRTWRARYCRPLRCEGRSGTAVLLVLLVLLVRRDLRLLHRSRPPSVSRPELTSWLVEKTRHWCRYCAPPGPTMGPNAPVLRQACVFESKLNRAGSSKDRRTGFPHTSNASSILTTGFRSQSQN